MKNKKTQSLLESTLAYIAGMMLLGAIIAIAAIGNAQIPIRQITYELSRIMAGTPMGRSVTERGANTFTGASGDGKGALWPTYVAAGF
ncbi:MAG: hypothetical protein ABH865_01360 [Candidatus Omnitrophota bacterium]|nr:hypothetical protein [Candidatus Omnitrophota bacterium]